MRPDGVSIIEAIKFVRAQQRVDLGEAKAIVSQHPSYEDIHRAHKPLHDELISYLEEGLLDPPSEPS